MKPILGYWDLRGRANTIRMLLHYVGEDFEDKRYPLTDFSEWREKDKIRLQNTLDFPNLPYYIDETVKMTQSRAILQYLGRKYKLDGTNEVELARMGVIFDQAQDLMTELSRVSYPPKVENKKEIHDLVRKEYVEALPGRLAAIAKFLRTNEWMAGSCLTYVDFYIYDVLDFQRRLFLAKHLNTFPTLVAYLQRMEGLKGVKEYLNSESFKPMPIFGPFAMFGSTEDYEASE